MLTKTPESKYAHLTREQLEQLLEKRDRERKLGLMWERDDLETDQTFITNVLVT
jgi:adenine-specific DNA-methyltransferase